MNMILAALIFAYFLYLANLEPEHRFYGEGHVH